MNTNQIRKFATEARILLLKGVSNSLRSFFHENGEPIIEPKPVQGGCVFGAQTKDEVFLRRWQSLQHQITLHGFRWVVEQVAYTWFNRLVAINILAKNNLAEPMLQFANPALRVPYIVEQARAGHFPEMSAADIATLRELLNNDALTFEQFSLLIGCYCTANPIIRRCFGRVDDYSFLLLPSNILFEGEIVDMLNRSDLITDDDYCSPELIGWLYQFYISERKDEVFSKKGKFEADEIPAATQIFTPNWIVKYMVQNSLGRIYLDNEPDSDLKERMNYLVGGAVSHCSDTKYSSKLCDETSHLLNFVNKKKYIYITGNKLPHWNQRDCVQFVTFRLADSLPQVKLQEYKSIKDKWLEAHPKPWDLATQAEYDSTIGAEIDKWLDAGYGNCILKDEKIRKIVEEAILHFNGEKYFLHAYVIMPNHVHVLLTPIEGNLVQSIVGSWKKFSAHEINYTLGRSGSVWERECFDRMIRSNDDFEAKLNYIKNNPQGLSSSSYTLNIGGAVSHCTNTNDSPKLCGETPHLLFTDVRELTCADLACGSGHILNECFDLLYDIYIEQGYSRRDAVENIFSHNLSGVDIDTRAKQLATFALLLKACRRDATFADAHAMPRVLDMPEPYRSDSDLRDTLRHFFLGGTPKQIDETAEAIALFDYAEDLGSIMRFNISPGTREAIVRRLAEYRASQIHTYDDLFPYFDVILALTDRYAAVVMNPPYMGGGNMNATLSKYLKDNYEEGKADLFSVFMLLAIDRLLPNGKYGMINIQSWMFLSSFEKLRTRLLTENRIDNMLHLGPRTFDELSGEVVQNTAFVITNCKGKDATGAYYRLVDGKNCGEKERMFLEAKENGGNRICYPNVYQQNFDKIPGSPIGYWVSEAFLKTFDRGVQLRESASVPKGLSTGSVEKFLRFWHECNHSSLDFDSTSCQESSIRGLKWFPYAKGGTFRRWSGNLEYVVNWENNGCDVKNFVDENGKQRSRPQNTAFYFKECLTYSAITSGKYSLRYLNKSIFGGGGDAIHMNNIDDIYYYLAFMNTSIAQSYLRIISPTLNFEVNHIKSIPIILKKNDSITELCRSNIVLSRCDWDAHETSWDFKQNELVKIGGAVSHCTDTKYSSKLCDETSKFLSTKCDGTSHLLLEDLMNAYKQKWERLFMQLHANEEELNRQFIDIYGLQDELTPDVPLDEITILQQGEIHIENNDIVWHNDVIAKQLISYAIGCWMGRYRLDKPGLHIAHPNPTAEEVCTYTYNGSELEIDDDGIIPILSADSQFADNACHRLRDFLRIAFGEENLLENINFIETCLGKSIEAYFMKDFWKDHKKMYQNRPIYWLFSSKKGAFQCLAYMHRMDAYTVERVRSKYLLPHMDWLTHRINELRANDAMLTTAQRKTAELLEKELAECREYHERLHYVADQQISFDLDDGVVVNYAKFGDILTKIK